MRIPKKKDDIIYTQDGDEITAQYRKATRQPKSLKALKGALSRWRFLANDARLAVRDWTQADFDEYLIASRETKKDIYKPSHDRFAVVWLPTILFYTDMIAMQFHAPWGCAFHRLLDLKVYNINDGYVERVKS